MTQAKTVQNNMIDMRMAKLKIRANRIACKLAYADVSDVQRLRLLKKQAVVSERLAMLGDNIFRKHRAAMVIQRGIWYRRFRGKGMHGKGMHGKGMHGKGMHGKGMHGKGMHGKGMHGKGMHGKGMHGKGMHGKGMHGKGIRGKGMHGKGVHGKGMHGTHHGKGMCGEGPLRHGEAVCGKVFSPYGSQRDMGGTRCTEHEDMVHEHEISKAMNGLYM